jgi:hypothetical protein
MITEAGRQALNDLNPDQRGGLLRRWFISLPVLKYGMNFSVTTTAAPERGLRPVRAPRLRAENTPKPRISTRSLREQRRLDHPQDRVDGVLKANLVEMGILRGKASNKL